MGGFNVFFLLATNCSGSHFAYRTWGDHLLVLVYDFSLRMTFLTLSAEALPSSYLGRSKGLCSQGRLAWTLPIHWASQIKVLALQE